MNVASFLLCLVFAAIGYVIYPVLLPKLVDSNVVAESSLSDEYKAEQAKKELPKPAIKPEKDVAKEDETPEPVRLTTPDVAVAPTPAIPDPVTPPAPVVPEKVVTDTTQMLNENQLIALLEASVKAGDVNEFEFDQVLEWKQAGTEDVGGENFQIGMVTYKADTIFDEQELQAKALIKDGKVVKWLWPTTNTEMR